MTEEMDNFSSKTTLVDLIDRGEVPSDPLGKVGHTPRLNLSGKYLDKAFEIIEGYLEKYTYYMTPLNKDLAKNFEGSRSYFTNYLKEACRLYRDKGVYCFCDTNLDELKIGYIHYTAHTIRTESIYCFGNEFIDPSEQVADKLRVSELTEDQQAKAKHWIAGYLENGSYSQEPVLSYLGTVLKECAVPVFLQEKIIPWLLPNGDVHVSWVAYLGSGRGDISNNTIRFTVKYRDGGGDKVSREMDYSTFDVLEAWAYDFPLDIELKLNRVSRTYTD